MQGSWRNLLIGVFVITAAIIVGWTIVFIHPCLGDEGQILYARFNNIDKVNVGARVNFAGRPVGTVTAIEADPHAREKACEQDAPIYPYILTLAVDSHVKVYTTDQIALRTAGLLGERSISIVPRKPQLGQTQELVTSKMILTAEASKSLEEVMAYFDEHHTYRDIAEGLRNIRDITGALNNAEAWSEIVLNVQDFTSSFKRVAGNVETKWPAIAKSIDDIGASVSNVRGVTARMAEGKGTVGRLFHDDSLYLQLGSILTKGEILMNDINHYGLLFHLDRTWQKQRTRRANQMAELCTASQFRNYFEEETDQISTSVARVSVMMDRLECQGAPAMMSCREYTQAMRELMRRVSDVQERLQLINSEINAAAVEDACASPCAGGP